MNQAKIDLLDKLYQIRHNGPRQDKCGICFNVMTFENVRLLERLIYTWPKHSGVAEFPIHVGDARPEASYTQNLNKWDKSTEYGQLRWELLEHCIVQLEGEFKCESK